jgi:hexosaminidase
MTRSPLLFAIAAGLAFLAGPAAAGAAGLVPAPAVETPADGVFRLSAHTPVVVPAADPGARAAAAYFTQLIARSRGLGLEVTQAGAAPAVSFRRGGPVGEGYRLDAGPGGLVITATDDAGLFYGGVTAWQLATAQAGRGAAEIAGVHIEDAPRFAWRGLMLDSARHFQSPDYIKALLDRMARAKLNTFHWHLTDDQGWRLEIRKYPRLTEVGAWRVPAGAGPAQDIDPKTGQPRRIGGFYTQDQVREIVAYAAARHIAVVPEIEMPGHATAAIAAYPRLGTTQPPPSGPSSDWGVFDDLFNVDEATFGVLQDVLDEVMALFPGRYIHVGGDEAVKIRWKASPAVQARMRELHIASENQLQGWFTARIEQYLNAHGRALIGWDEILEGGVAPSAAVMSWRGTDGAIVAAKMGHDTVLAPAPTYYFDNRQGADPGQPPGRGSVIDLRQVYDFEPVPAALSAEQARHVLGVQAQIWTEHVRTEDRVSKMLFPRAYAVAETGWSPASRRSWTDFAARLGPEIARERALGAATSDFPGQVVTPDPHSRRSQELKLCSDRFALNLEDDAPARGPRAVFLVDIMNPCWIWEGADLTGVRRLTASVGQLPFNFQLGEAAQQIRLAPPATPDGELLARLDGCTGPVVATLPLAPATRSQATSVLSGALTPTEGRHDLCITFTRPKLDPLWVLNRLTLGEPPRER